MKKNLKVSLLAGMVLLLTVTVSLGGLSLAEAGSVSADDAIATQDILVQKYMTASGKITESQILMAEAFGLKEEKEKLESLQAAYASGNVADKNAIKKQRAVTDSVNKEINKKMEEGAELSAESKKLYAKSLVPYSLGVALFKESVVPEAEKSVDDAKNVIANGSLVDKLKLTKKLGTIFYLAPKVVPELKSLLSGASKYITYAKKNNITVPKDATDSLGDL